MEKFNAQGPANNEQDSSEENGYNQDGYNPEDEEALTPGLSRGNLFLIAGATALGTLGANYGVDQYLAAKNHQNEKATQEQANTQGTSGHVVTTNERGERITIDRENNSITIDHPEGNNNVVVTKNGSVAIGQMTGGTITVDDGKITVDGVEKN